MSENVAETETAFDALWAWRGSSTGHNDNMLNPAWRAIGIARERGQAWRWATSYGSVQDCPAAGEPGTATTQSTAAAREDEEESEPFQPTPSKGGVEVQEETPPASEPSRPTATRAGVLGDGQPSPATEDATADEPSLAAAASEAPPMAQQVADETAEGPLYAPTAALAMDDERPSAGEPVQIANRSRDSPGTPIGARFLRALGVRRRRGGRPGRGQDARTPTRATPSSRRPTGCRLGDRRRRQRLAGAVGGGTPVLPPYL